MRYLGPVEAANAIRDQITRDQSARVSPEAAHEMAFVKEVCQQLGMDATPENVQHVTLVLRERGISVPNGQEYPKYVTRKSDNTQHVVHSREEEQAKVDEPTPELVRNEPVRTVDEPVQFGNSDYQSDISDIVPKTSVSSKTELERLTDHEAAQGQLPDGVDPDNFDDGVVIDSSSGIVHPNAEKGVLAKDDADRDGIRGQDVDPTHDNGFIRQDMKDGTINAPRPHSAEVSADEVEKGKLKQPGNKGKRPV